jgi:hypothetical protein
MKKFFSFCLFISVLSVSCKKQVDYSKDIEDIRGQITAINNRLDSLSGAIKQTSSQLTNIESALRSKIDAANVRIDSISGALKSTAASTAQNIQAITNSIAALNTSISAITVSLATSNKDLKTKLDSINYRVDTTNLAISSIAKNLNDSLTTKITLINVKYNDLLANYLAILKLVETKNSALQLNGAIFKGGFLRGSLLNFYELDSALNQTGRSFNTTIDNDYGNYALKAQNLSGKLVRLVGDGFYWNEVTNANSDSRITLTGLCKVDSSEVVNVNVLTNLERPRVEYLYANGLSFDSAKKQAITEVLAAFGYKNTGIKRAEKVGLSGTRDERRILIALSTLVQGLRTESELTQLMGDIGEDIKTDGTLDNISIGNDLESHLRYIDTSAVLQNIKSRYASVYSTDTLQTLDMRFIKRFQDSTNYTTSKSFIEFPEFASYFSTQYRNVLNDTISTYDPRMGVVCKIKRKAISFKLVISDETGGSINVAYGGGGNTVLWVQSNMNTTPTFATDGMGTYDIMMDFLTVPGNKLKLTYYENGSSIPTRTRILTKK